jgi:hypothetical protein
MTLSQDQPRHDEAPDDVVHVIEHSVTGTDIPPAADGEVRPADWASSFKVGDTLTFRHDIYDADDKEQVGTDQGFCFRTSTEEGLWEAYWTTSLPDGQITVAGPYHESKDNLLAIIGGTGAYRGARGEVECIARDGATKYDFIFRIDR